MMCVRQLVAIALLMLASPFVGAANFSCQVGAPG